MVCAKCQKLSKPTALATPGVKKKSEMYYGSPAGTSKSGGTKTSATLGNTGISKNKLLSKTAKNPYASYGATCSDPSCNVKIEAGRKLCQKCAYKTNACAMCGKSNSKSSSGAPVISGQKFNLK